MIIRRCLLLLVVAVTASSVAQKPATAPVGTFRIAGIVVDRLTSQPLAEATVILAPVNDRRDEATFRTGGDGRFLFSNLPPGKYSLGGKRRGYTLQGFEQHESYSTAIAVGPEIDSERLVFRLRPDASIRGTITDENNEPAANIHIQLFGTRMENGENSVHHISQTSTDDRGQYSFPHLKEGTYYVAASGRPWYSDNFGFLQQARMQSTDPETKARIEQEAAKLDLVYPLTFYSGALSSDDATPIQLAVGDTMTADMALQPVRSVHIRIPAAPAPEVLERSGDPGIIVGSGRIIRGRAASAMPIIRFSQEIFGNLVDRDSFVTPVLTNPDGSHEVVGIAPGRYAVEVDQPGISKQPSTRQELDLDGDLDLSRSSGVPLTSVSGTMWLNGGPVDRAFVEIQALESHRAYAAQVRKGLFQFDESVPPGRYEISIGTNTNLDIYLSALSATGARVDGRSLQIASGQPVQLAIVASQGIAQIDGVAKLGDKPDAGVMILLVPDDFPSHSALARRDQSDSDGTFTLRQVVPGKYKLLAIENGWNLPWADPKVLKPFLASARSFAIQPSQKLQLTVDVQSAK